MAKDTTKTLKYEKPDLTRLDGGVEGQIGPCIPLGSAAIGACSDGNAAAGTGTCFPVGEAPA